MKTFAIFLLSKETFTVRTCSVLASFFRKLLSKATFERKLSSVSLTTCRTTGVPLPLYERSSYLSTAGGGRGRRALAAAADAGDERGM